MEDFATALRRVARSLGQLLCANARRLVHGPARARPVNPASRSLIEPAAPPDFRPGAATAPGCPADSWLSARLGSWVRVQLVTGRQHVGRLVDFNVQCLKLRGDPAGSVIVYRRAVASLESAAAIALEPRPPAMPARN